jgi:hypothetical protein
LHQGSLDLVLIVNNSPFLRDIEAVLPQDFDCRGPGAIRSLASRYRITDSNHRHFYHDYPFVAFRA